MRSPPRHTSTWASASPRIPTVTSTRSACCPPASGRRSSRRRSFPRCSRRRCPSGPPRRRAPRRSPWSRRSLPRRRRCRPRRRSSHPRASPLLPILSRRPQRRQSLPLSLSHQYTFQARRSSSLLLGVPARACRRPRRRPFPPSVVSTKPRRGRRSSRRQSRLMRPPRRPPSARSRAERGGIPGSSRASPAAPPRRGSNGPAARTLPVRRPSSPGR